MALTCVLNINSHFELNLVWQEIVNLSSRQFAENGLIDFNACKVLHQCKRRAEANLKWIAVKTRENVHKFLPLGVATGRGTVSVEQMPFKSNCIQDAFTNTNTNCYCFYRTQREIVLRYLLFQCYLFIEDIHFTEAHA